MTIRIGGEAGDGIESSGAGFCKALARGGLHVFGLPDYHSRIRGGHNFYSVRISEEPLYCHQEPVHMLLALTGETISRHQDQVAEGGAIVYDAVVDLPAAAQHREGVQFVRLPMSDMAEKAAGTTLARNTVALGFAAGITGFDLEPLGSVVRDNFAPKGQRVVDGNLAALEAGYKEGRTYADGFSYQLRPLPDAPSRLVVNGTDAFSLGALAGGCRFVAGYPMTPGSLALHWMAAHAQEYGVVVKHTEDEIAAINMAIGAAHMGVRAMVPTSGGGFSLMVEGLGLAAMTETPVVIYNAQRPGPATGLPTRQGQGDLLFMLRASQGEFSRFLLAPGTHEQLFVTGWRAFNLAEQYQVPVLVLGDHYLAVAIRTLEADAFDFHRVQIDRGALLSDAELDALEGEYLRFKVTESGVSPRALPGHPKAVYVASGNEHDERGIVNEERDVRLALDGKRLRKRATMTQEISGPRWYGPSEAETTYLCWGSTYGPLCEAVDRLNASDPGRANLLHLFDLEPFPTDAVDEALAASKRTVGVEGNATAQLATLIRAHTGRALDAQISRSDGRAFTPEYILRSAL
jgi:2-oxoglutarate ferredoxin oxidoreductase subunit alpha